MHDTYLLDRISQSLKELCEVHKIKRINQFSLVVNHQSHINEDRLRGHLGLYAKQIVGEDLIISVQRDDIEDQIAIIHAIQGETFEG